MDLVVSGLCKRFEETRALDGFSAVFPAGRATCIMGPSGCGKTTLLRVLMGLERPDSGTVSGLDGRRVGAVFQEDRLCENLAAPANARIASPSLSRARAEDALRAVGLPDEALRRPVRELSGGMARRVAVVRALLAPAGLLLFDEPFRGLDAESRALTIRYVLARAAGKTLIVVTHDPEEPALLGADTLVMGDAGGREGREGNGKKQ